MVRFLIEKEFRQISRNPILPRLILAFPVIVLLVFPWAANFEIKNLNLHVVDHDQTTWSKRLVEKAGSSGYFRLSGTSFDYNRALADIESDEADIILEIPAGFEASLTREQAAKVMISANAVNGTKGGMGSAYLSAIVQDFGKEVSRDILFSAQQTPMPVIEIIPYNRFNPKMDYKVFMVPALVVMLLTMLCGFLPALNIVAEKEAGTMEQINVTPVSRFTFIISKLLPYWLIGMTVLTITFGVAYLVYGLVPVGSLFTIYFFAIIYILAVSGAGLIISNYSETMQQAMFVIYFFMLILIILSGLFTPVNSMPEWAQFITRFNPLKYFMQVMRMVYLKGSTFSDLHTQFFALLSFAAVFNTWAVWSYRKRV